MIITEIDLGILLNLSHPEFMKWIFPSLNLDMSVFANRGVCQKKKSNREILIRRSLSAISSGSTRFAKVSTLILRDKMVKSGFINSVVIFTFLVWYVILLSFRVL